MNDEEMNFIDRFLYKLLILTFLLMSVVFLDKINLIDYHKLQVELSQHYNILNVIKAINGESNLILPIDLTDEVASNIQKPYLDSVELKSGKRRVVLDDYTGVEIYKTGVVVKIYENQDQTYTVTVKGIDDLEYVYDKLTSVDCNIYKIVNSGDILGLPSSKDQENYFEFYVKDKDEVVNIFP